VSSETVDHLDGGEETAMATRSARRAGTRRCIRGLIGAWATTAVVASAAVAGTASAAAATVACGGPGGGAAGLIAAIAHANSTAGADTIELAGGCTYVLRAEDNPGNGLPVITGTITVHGHGATITRSSESAFRVLEVAPGADLTLDRVTVSGGALSLSGPTAFGGGILNSGLLTVTDSTISDNSVRGTGSSAGGGGIANNGVVRLRNTVLRNNTASATGTQTIFAAVGGAVLNRTGATMTIADSVIEANSALATGSSPLFFIASGGGIGNTGTLAIDSSQLKGNRAVANGAHGQAGGGAISIADGTVTIAKSTIAGNTATATGAGASARGGGVENNGRTKLTDTVVKGNLVSGPTAQGGGLANGRRLTLVRSHVVANIATATSGPGQGGGIFTDAGRVILNNTEVANNQPDDCQPFIPGC